ncbi:hypothetical protein KR018_008454 [Drosophila ironensis]|nr:hypothetical protein KR018_008454 [Drosophila ironensis]
MDPRQDDRAGDEAIGGGSGGIADPPPYRIPPPREEVVSFLAHQQSQHNQNFLLHQQQHGRAHGPLLWPPPHLAASSPFPPHLQQPAPPPQPQPQPQQPPQPHIFNEYIYNLSYSGQPGQPESYSVLPVGRGNFLKVYHCPENTGTDPSAPRFTHINVASLSHQHRPQHHPQLPNQSQHHHQPSSSTAPQPTPLYELFAANPLLPQPETNMADSSKPTQQAHPSLPNNANLLINNLVNNWSPNLTGGSYIKFGDDAKENTGNQVQTPGPSFPMPMPSSQQPPKPTQAMLEPSEPASQSTSLLTETPKPAKSLPLHLTTTASVVQTAIPKSSIVVSGPSEGKKRIVAEVKPMPMSYSDVLSKGTKSSGAGREIRSGNRFDSVGHHQRRPGKDDGVESREVRLAKRSPMHDAKEMTASASGGNANGGRGKKRGQFNQAASQKQQQQQQQQQQQHQPQQQQFQQPVQQTLNKASKATNQEKKRVLVPKNNSSGNSNGNNFKFIEQKTNSTPSAANSGSHSPAVTNSSRRTGCNKVNQNASSTVGNCNNNNISSSSSKRYSSSNVNVNSNSNSGYSYSSKRNRGNPYASSNSPSHAGSFASNHNYELAQRILHTWWVYTLKLLTWLFYLVYDIVVLGFTMSCERLTLVYVAGLAYAKQFHKELKQNSGKPTIWWRSYCRRFDARFAKNSPWAFWRRFYKRKPPESTTESFKSGRLPQTGEEAMFSLLNCKGKDAYSILGVPPDSSQEQIRKHYKKIAVLVHPDKNKQAGAEEAFKVLQRAFELIGEPENRLMYDQSIAKTLHTEKAWTELHDLLSQLKNKMTEAANTIRCSTCAQRHPRKLTDRPHYAARECASCKIRHSAKDGDIWAETSMLGLRWKYLALMDTKVYDITEWANCQKGALSHLEPNSHVVQYRIVRGAQQQQQQQPQQQPQHHNQQQPQQERSGHHPGVSGVSEATLHEFLDNLYSGQHPGAPHIFAGNTRRRTRRN